MEILASYTTSFLSALGPFFLLLGILIFVHELGHFLVAKFFGVRVETFSLGFGKKILSYKKGDTTYCISLIPLGGYVKMYGDDPTKEIPEAEKKYSFLHKPVWPRIWIVLAGPLMNLFFAIVLFGFMGSVGEPVPGTQLGDVAPETAAYEAGFRSGDKILKVGGEPVSEWKTVKEYIETRPNEKIAFEVEREKTKTNEVIEAETTLMPNPFIFTSRREIGWIAGLDLDSRATLVAVPDSKSYVAQKGLQSFDQIKSINGEELLYWRDLAESLRSAAQAGESVKLVVQNYKEQNSEERTVELESSEVLRAADISSLGIANPELMIYRVNEDSPAAKAGLKQGDLVVGINGQSATRWEQLLETVKNYKADDGVIQFKVVRAGEEQQYEITPELTEIPTAQGGIDERYAIGVSPAIVSMANPSVISSVEGFFPAVQYGVVKSWEWTKLISISLVRLVQAEVSPRNIGGVISIGRVASQSYDMGWLAFFKMMAIISINLFLLNLLPVPVLDGGHLVFFTIEALKGSPLSLKKMEMAQQVGLVLLLSLMVFALVNDITHLISPPW